MTDRWAFWSCTRIKYILQTGDKTTHSFSKRYFTSTIMHVPCTLYGIVVSQFELYSILSFVHERCSLLFVMSESEDILHTTSLLSIIIYQYLAIICWRVVPHVVARSLR